MRNIVVRIDVVGWGAHMGPAGAELTKDTSTQVRDNNGLDFISRGDNTPERRIDRLPWQVTI